MLKLICIAVLSVVIIGVTAQSAKATTVSTLLSDWRSDIGEEDSTNSRFTNAQGRRLLTRGTNMVGVVIGGVEAQSKIALRDSVSDYTISGYWGVDAVLYKTDVDYIHLVRVVPENLGTRKFSAFTPQAAKPEGESDAVTALERYAIFKDTLMLYPTLPNMDGDTLYIKGFVAPASLDSNSQTTQLKIWTDEFVVEAAVFLANKRDISLGDELSWWTSFAQRILAAQAIYVRKEEAQAQPAPTQ